MTNPARGIEDFFRRRYGREALYLPSGRLALYLAFREWLRPGDRILLSPINDDVVFFTVLAAGLVPVVGPLDPLTGNLDPAAARDDLWPTLKAVMTTNLYGIPDRMDLLTERCRRHGLLLIEDACQALDSRLGDRRIGEIASVAAFSLTKHVSGTGGVLCFSEGERTRSLVRRAEAEIRRRNGIETIREGARLLFRDAAARTGTRRPLAALLRRFHPIEPEREGHRVPYDLSQVVQASEEGGGLDRFHRWVRVDNANYRTAPFAREIEATFRRLENFEENRRLRLEGARKLFDLGLTPSAMRLPREDALFRVPLFVQKREEARRHFANRGFDLDYIYDPPLDLYAPAALAERVASPGAALAWSRDVLPVDPLRADRFLAIMKGSPGVLSAADRTYPERGPSTDPETRG